MIGPEHTQTVPGDRLRRFIRECLLSVDAVESEAAIVADALVSTDLRGVESHGVARLRRYVDGLRRGTINRSPQLRVVSESPATVLLDADNGLGQPAGTKAMDLAIAKSAAAGVGVVAVRKTNHFGMAAYYAMRALESGMIGIAISNASPQVAPTFGAEPMYGTNPMAIAIPTSRSVPFVLDMATSTVPRGKLERMHWHGEAMPIGWAVDPSGAPTTDLPGLIEGLKRRSGHALLPLGGGGDVYGGHKGFGLGLVLDLLCGPLAGASWGRHVYGPSGADLGQWFIAMQVEAFRPRDEFLEEAERLLVEIRATRRATDAARIFIHGEKEAEETARRKQFGIPLPSRVWSDLTALSQECGVQL